jgi:hypothetical protein
MTPSNWMVSQAHRLRLLVVTNMVFAYYIQSAEDAQKMHSRRRVCSGS